MYLHCFYMVLPNDIKVLKMMFVFNDCYGGCNCVVLVASF